MEYKVEIRKRRGSRRFSFERYPGFSYKKTGRYAYHWESVADDAQLSIIKERARADRFDMRAVPVEYARSANYRKDFIAKDPGPYRCRYCHRRIDQGSLTVDHLVPVAMAGRSKVARRILELMGATGVNDAANLVPACRSCNSRKADKGGIWIVRGLLGKYKGYWVFLCASIALLAILAASACVALACGQQGLQEKASIWMDGLSNALSLVLSGKSI